MLLIMHFLFFFFFRSKLRNQRELKTRKDHPLIGEDNKNSLTLEPRNIICLPLSRYVTRN